MLISTFTVLAHIFLSPSFGADIKAMPAKLVCAEIFDDTHKDLNRDIFEHIVEAERANHGIPDADRYLNLDANRRLRFYTDTAEAGQTSTRTLRIENLRLVGESYTVSQVRILESIFSVASLQILRNSDGTFRVSRWIAGKEIKLDVHTGFMRADDKVVEDILRGLITSRGMEGQSAILFLDLDNLNLVNYLPGGHDFGDRYIRESLRVITSSLRLSSEPTSNKRYTDRDIGFRLQNGDEYFFVLQGINREGLVAVQNRINDAITRDTKIQGLISEAKASYGRFLSNLTQLKSYQELQSYNDPKLKNNVYNFIISSDFWSSASPNQLGLVKENPAAFQAFMKAYVESAEAKLRGNRIASLQLGASTSVVMITTGHTYESLKSEADQIMQQVKISRKYDAIDTYGLDMVHYNKSDIHFPYFELRP